MRGRPRLAAAALLGLVLGACAGAAGDTTTLPTTTTASPPTPATSTTAPPDGWEILVAHDDGIDLVTEHGRIAVLRGRPIAFAIPDLSGGVIFQETGQWEQDWPPRPIPIEWLPRPGAEPAVLVDGAGANALTPLQVTGREEARVLLYRRMNVPGNGDDAMFGQEEYLVMRDLSDGTDRVLGVIGAFESSLFTVHIGGGGVAISWSGYADEGACAGVVDLDLLFSLGADEWIGSLCAGPCCRFGPTPGYGFGEYPCCETTPSSVRAALAPDGSRLAVVSSSPLGTTLTQVDLATGGTTPDLAVGDPGEWVAAVDYDGLRTLVTLRASDGSLRILLVEGTSTILHLEGVNGAWFWRVDSPES